MLTRSRALLTAAVGMLLAEVASVTFGDGFVQLLFLVKPPDGASMADLTVLGFTPV